MAFFGLKLGLDLNMRAAHPHQKFQGVLSPPPSVAVKRALKIKFSVSRKESSEFLLDVVFKQRVRQGIESGVR